MKLTVPAFLVLCTLAAGGCTGDKGKELFETAQFEEKQHNVDHAAQLYREIIRKHAGSEYAAKAGQRLTELGQKQ